MKVRHYKNGTKMVPVVFTDPQEIAAWDKLCAKIKAQHPSDPHPYYEDYHRFINENDARRNSESV